MKKAIKKILAGLLLGLIVITTWTNTGVSADEEKEEYPCILLDKYEISDGGIVPGSSFTLTLKLKNYSDVDAENLVLNISNPSGVMPKYGTASQRYIGEIKGNSSKEITFEYEAFTSITADYLNFGVTLYNDIYNNSLVLAVPVSTDVTISITGVGGPTEVTAKEAASYYVQFKTLGTENVSSVNVVAKVGGKEKSSYSIGIMKPDTTKSQSLTMQFDEAGTFEVELFVTYLDAAGVNQEVLAGTVTVTVSEADPVPTPTTIPAENPENQADGIDILNNPYVMAGIAAITALLIILVIVIIIKKKK